MFQALVMLGGLVAVLIVGVLKVGGFGNVWDRLDRGGRLHFIEYVFLSEFKLIVYQHK